MSSFYGNGGYSSGGGEDPEEEATNRQMIGQLQSDIAVVQRQVAGVAGGTPTVVDAKADMTERDKIYILSSDGKWYYYSATAEDWLVGGTYGGAVTDTTLSISGSPADSKVVGDTLAEKADADDVTALTAVVEGDIDDINGRLDGLSTLLDYTDTMERADNPTNWRIGYVRANGTYGSDTQNIVNRTMYAGNGKSCTITMDTGWAIKKVFEYGTADDVSSFVEAIFNDEGAESVTVTLKAEKFYVFQIRKDPVQTIESIDDMTDDTIIITYPVTTSSVIDGLNENITELSDDLDSVSAEVEDVKSAVAEVVEPKIVPTVTFTDGKGINQSTGALVSDSEYSYSDYIETSGMGRVLLTMPLLPSSLSRGIAFYASDKTYISGFRCIINADGGAVERSLPIPENAVYFRTTWFSTTSEQYPLCEFKCELNDGRIVDDGLTAVSANALDVSKISYGYLINVSNIKNINDAYCVTDFIPVKQGETLVLASAPTHVAKEMLYVTAFDLYKENVPALGASSVYSYTVPEGVGYVRVSARAVSINNFSYIHRDGTTGVFQPYMKKSVSEVAGENYDTASAFLRYPLSTLPSHIVKNLAYKPLGQLSKGYICFVSDDGRADLANYTIPMFVDKGVPGTWAVMSQSEVFADATMTATVVDSVQNHGCEIAMHGLTNWDSYDEYSLVKYFDAQDSTFAGYGLTAHGAVCPSHHINEIISAVAGPRYGCLRTGFAYGVPYYDNYMNGPRSNLYGLSCYSIHDGTLQNHKDHIDKAITDHLLCIVFWHDNNLPTETREKFEAVIDYALASGITFITMKDIPTIT